VLGLAAGLLVAGPLLAGGVAGGVAPVSLSVRGSLRIAVMMPGVVSVMVRHTVACFMSGR
jgi:hypothetical protein